LYHSHTLLLNFLYIHNGPYIIIRNIMNCKHGTLKNESSTMYIFRYPISTDVTNFPILFGSSMSFLINFQVSSIYIIHTVNLLKVIKLIASIRKKRYQSLTFLIEKLRSLNRDWNGFSINSNKYLLCVCAIFHLYVSNVYLCSINENWNEENSH